jgi:tetratricopeptide (TPR) repeat protein
VIDDAVVRRLLAALDEEGAQDALRARRALSCDDLDELVQHAGRLAVDDPAAAARLLDVAETAARGLGAGAEAVLPASGYLRARLTLEAGHPGQALELIAIARAEFERLGMSAEAARTDLGRMHALDDLGRHAEAVEVGRALLGSIGRPRDDDLPAVALRASASGNLGVALGFTGHHVEALRAYHRAEVGWRWLGDDEAVAAARANQGIELLALGRARAAVRRLEAAAAVFEAAGDRFWHAKCLGHIGEALMASGRFGDALKPLRSARNELADLSARTEYWRFTVVTAALLLALGLADESVVVVDDVVPALREAEVRHDLARALAVRGTALARAGRPDEARPVLGEAAELYRRVGDVPAEAATLLDLSRCLPDVAAADVARRAAALVDPEASPAIACLCALRLAEVHTENQDVAAAQLQVAQRLAAGLGLPQLRQAVDLHRGVLLLDRGEVDAGIALLDAGLAAAERIGSGLRDTTLRTAYLASRAVARDRLIGAVLSQAGPGHADRAAALSDRAKVAPQAGGAAASRQSAPGGRAHLVEELNAAYTALFEAGTRSADEAGAHLRTRVEVLERRLSALRVLEPDQTPPDVTPYAPASGRQVAPAGSASVARPVPGDVAGVVCVAYHVLGEEVLAFVTVAGRLVVRRKVTDVPRLLALLDDLEAHVGAQAVGVLARHSRARADACRRVLQELYLAVMAPVRDLLPTSPLAQPLVVVPHGPLHAVPFHALHDGYDYVLLNWIISVWPSLGVGTQAAARPAATGRSVVLGVADPATPFAEEEARQVAAVVGDSELFVGAAATFGHLRAHAEGAAVVHLACHGLFRPGNAAFTSLRLADRWVHASDVAELDLRGSLLVLSACETGRAGSQSGDQVAGLARSFLAAGARCVVVSRWLVDDRSAAVLMTRFHRRLAAGRDPASALRDAQLAALIENPHAFYWAPFTVIGAGSSGQELS